MMPSPLALLALLLPTLASAGPGGLLGVNMAPYQDSGRQLADDGRPCRTVALNLMPPPSLKSYLWCFRSKMAANSTHDWSVPGADLGAQTDCWCAHNISLTMEEYGCCDHADVYPMCTLDCNPDCDGQFAQECVEECPSMCLEVGEYVVDSARCARCDWAKCWPVLKCITERAKQAVEDNEEDRTCHEPDFQRSEELRSYWDCWRDTPKHSSHWNVLSSVRHCVCRERVAQAAQEASCCGSRSWGGGVCEVECLSEAQCNTQDAQTCVHECQEICPAFEVSPTAECRDRCLSVNAPCRQYLSCRPPLAAGHICDDGRWPEASSGCCEYNNSGTFGCPGLCETHRVWRVDTQRAIPWWARYNLGYAPVIQCSCMDCPVSEHESGQRLRSTVAESIWDNGQMMLVDIARREGLQLGPNRKMQELMLERNERITAIVGEDSRTNAWQANLRVQEINDEFAWQITTAARESPDDGEADAVLQERRKRVDWGIIVFVMVVCTCCIACTLMSATWMLLRKRRTLVEVPDFAGNDNVVIGQPVRSSDPDAEGVVMGAAATVCAAPMKSPSASYANSDLRSPSASSGLMVNREETPM